MKIYLTNPPYKPGFTRDARWQDASRAGTTYYPIWLAYATAILEQEHEVRLVDAPVWNWSREQMFSDIRQFQPDLVVIDTSFSSLDNDISIAEIIKEKNPLAINIMVGAPTSLFADKMLASRGVDLVARKEFDFTLKEIAEAMDNSKGFQYLKGISYKDKGEMIHNPDREFSTSSDLDGMPFVSQVYQRHLNIKDYFLNYSLYPMVQVFGGRGCPFQCTFCYWPQTFMGRKHRMRSPSNVVDEMEWVRNNLPEIKAVFFEDDTFTINKKWVLAFTEEYKKRGLSLPWACQARADLDYETMNAMHEANCLTAVVGYESGSNALLKNVKKGITVEGSRQFIQDASRARLPIHGNFMFGLPGETPLTVKMTKKLAMESRSIAITVEAATPFPGTEFYNWSKDNGYLFIGDTKDYSDEQGRQKIAISYPQLSNVEIGKAVDQTLKGYFLSPRYIPIALKRLFNKHGWQELKVLLHSARMFLRYYFKGS
ncbi:radical SAM protein [Chloroflexota bacterium]